MKKSILVSLMLFLNASAYALTYCPQTITCDMQGCQGLPNGFYASSSYPKVKTTYSFSHAQDGTRIGVHPVICAYGGIDITRDGLRADINYPGNQWHNTMLEGLYLCRDNPYACPFK